MELELFNYKPPPIYKEQINSLVRTYKNCAFECTEKPIKAGEVVVMVFMVLLLCGVATFIYQWFKKFCNEAKGTDNNAQRSNSAKVDKGSTQNAK